MKAESTIRRMIRQMQKVCDNPVTDEKTRGEVYEAYHALRWAIEDTEWTPMSLARLSLGART